VAVKVTKYVPACDVVGDHWNVPEVFPAEALNVPPALIAVPAAVSDAIPPPKGATAVTVNVIELKVGFDTVAGAVTTGGTAHSQTVTPVAADPDSAFVAVKVIV
jgi:hypothetical protein